MSLRNNLSKTGTDSVRIDPLPRHKYEARLFVPRKRHFFEWGRKERVHRTDRKEDDSSAEVTSHSIFELAKKILMQRGPTPSRGTD